MSYLGSRREILPTFDKRFRFAWNGSFGRAYFSFYIQRRNHIAFLQDNKTHTKYSDIFSESVVLDRLNDKDISFVHELVTAAQAKYSEVFFLIVGGWQQLFVIFF